MIVKISSTSARMSNDFYRLYDGCDNRLAETVSKSAKLIPVSQLRKIFARCFECVTAKRYNSHTFQAISTNPH